MVTFTFLPRNIITKKLEMGGGEWESQWKDEVAPGSKARQTHFHQRNDQRMRDYASSAVGQKCPQQVFCWGKLQPLEFE